MFYNQLSPAQSTTSLSDDEDELNRSTFFASPEPLVATPATWSRLHITPSSTSTPSHSPASRLPPEILINVFKHLHSSRDIHSTLLVSRAWCECSVELLWHKPSVPNLNTLIKIMQVLSREDRSFTYGQFIRRLNLLSVGSEMTDNMFARLSQCTRLERVTLVGCSGLSDDVIARTLPSFPNLVAIDLSGVDSVTDRTVMALAKNCHKLQGINLLGCKHVSSVSVKALADNCPLLRRVKLSGLVDLTDEAVSALAIKSSLLLEVDLNGCKDITDLAVRDIWTHSVNMREMRLSQCAELTDSAFPAPQNSREPPPVGTNPFPEYTAVKFGVMVMDLPPLRLPRMLEHLRMLDLTNCSKITDDAVEGIIQSAPRIRNLVLSKCGQLTDRSVESICLLGKHLHYLHLGHASSITDRSVKTLARTCTRLRYIDLANCNQLTDMSVFELASLPKLRRIGLVRVGNLTDEAIYALGDRHSTLERVHLSYCDQISVMAIHFLLQKLHKLNHLSLTGVPTFRRQELQQFCRTPPADFNTTQRSQFCVYSGDGVNKLRRFLMDLFNSITDEISAQTDAEEDEEDDTVQGYEPMDVDPEPEPESTPITRRRSPPMQMPAPIPMRRTSARPSQSQSYPSSSTARVASPQNWDRDQQPPPAAGQAGGRWFALPFFGENRNAAINAQATVSPAPSDGSGSQSVGHFFRTYAVEETGAQHLNPALRGGAMTPDLVFAEIGHGRGVGGAPQAGTSTPQAPHIRRNGREPTVLPAYVNGNGHAAQGGPAMEEMETFVYAGQRNGDRSAPTVVPSNGAWPTRRIGVSGPRNGADPGVAGPSRDERGRPRAPRELQESVQAALAPDGVASTQNGATSAGNAGDPRARGVKRALRSTINAVEQHFFGRAPPEGEGSNGVGGSSGSSLAREDGTRGH